MHDACGPWKIHRLLHIFPNVSIPFDGQAEVRRGRIPGPTTWQKQRSRTLPHLSAGQTQEVRITATNWSLSHKWIFYSGANFLALVNSKLTKRLADTKTVHWELRMVFSQSFRYFESALCLMRILCIPKNIARRDYKRIIQK